ncbi:MAG: hypothetical protein B6D61_13940 [Bacteroidetes bacterium 4484_249]|nr:MAG: hypothetical protein B6D61_13940 [Bacteroidetes bacterium 4484_249]
MTASDYKMQVFKEIMPVESELALKQIYKLVHSFLNEYQKISKRQKVSKKLSFDEWNKQFTDDQHLDDLVPEYDKTLREFRKVVYESEMGEEIDMKEFKESLKTW